MAHYEDLLEVGGYLLGALRRSASPRWTFADVLAERSVHITARQVDGGVADANVRQDAGVALRVLDGPAVRQSAFDQMSPAAAGRALRGLGVTPRPWPPGPAPRLGRADPDADVDLAGLLSLMQAVDDGARAADPRVAQVLVDAEIVTRSLVTSRLGGGLVAEQRHLCYLTIQVVARERGRVATGFYTPASSRPGPLPGGADLGREAARRAVTSLAARSAPVARAPVVVAGGRGIVLIHEACCHPLEADEILRGSVYAGLMGEALATPLVTIVDDPTVEGAVGTMRADDEGGAAAPTPLVEEGRLVGFLADEVSARRLGARATGNGRRADYRRPVLPRMTNTCVAAGTTDPADIVADTSYGIWAQHVAGGEVVESTGDFVFRVTNGYLIENGVITDPIQETTISGNGRKVLLDIDAVGTDVQLGAAKCGKFDQVVPVGVQGPTLRVRNLLVGGTEK